MFSMISRRPVGAKWRNLGVKYSVIFCEVFTNLKAMENNRANAPEVLHSVDTY
jgi:hypothetical protein